MRTIQLRSSWSGRLGKYISKTTPLITAAFIMCVIHFIASRCVCKEIFARPEKPSRSFIFRLSSHKARTFSLFSFHCSYERGGVNMGFTSKEKGSAREFSPSSLYKKPLRVKILSVSQVASTLMRIPTSVFLAADLILPSSIPSSLLDLFQRFVRACRTPGQPEKRAQTPRLLQGK